MGRPEDIRVKIPALLHFTRIGYAYKSIREQKKGVCYDGDTNIFYTPFRTAINRINNVNLSVEDTENLISELKIKLDNEDLGYAFFQILQAGIKGLKIIDFNNPKNNIYSVVTELPYENGDDSFRPDITVLINGMPLSFVEVKRQNNKNGIRAEHNRMAKRFSNPIYRRFANITQFMVFSNNTQYDDTEPEPLQGSFYATSSYEKMFFSKFREQREKELQMKELDMQVEYEILKDNNLLSIRDTAEYKSSLNSDTSTNSMISSLYSIERILFLLHYGICYCVKTDKHGIKRTEKHIMRYPQMFATLAIRDMMKKVIKKGIIWHTQGSGKTELAFYNVKYLTDYYQRENMIAKFYFIVDRLSLAEQAKNEFESRGLKVVLVKDKQDFEENIATVNENSNTGELMINVVNIQKFSKESFAKPSDYHVSIKRIYFLDEAHRSYNPTGSFLANLISSDREAVIIALTGTPLIGEGYHTKDVFGDYIHKYYYNESIADGYTLRLIREEIETSYRSRMAETLKELEVQFGSLKKKEVYAHPKFVSDMTEYIITNYGKSRKTMDDSIGAMIVCDSSEQAREVDRQLKRIAAYAHALVLHDEGTKKDRKNIQDDFKKGKIDILVVYNMLLTGFDAPRLKKQYLARMVKAHNLLQTLTRVNRPYKDYRYGYVVDFANIKDEFDKTNKAYFDELQNELGDEVKNYSELFKSQNEIQEELAEIKEQLFLFDTKNITHFIDQISEIEDKTRLFQLRKILDNYKVLNNLMQLFGYEELKNNFAIETVGKLLGEVNNRIAIMNLKDNIEHAGEMSSVLNEALDQIDFKFRKIKEEELVIADAFQNLLEKTRKEVVDRCLDPKDPEYVTLLEELKRVFRQKNIEELNSDEMKGLMNELEQIRKKASERNRADQMLADKYNGDVKYMRTHKRVLSMSSSMMKNSTLFQILMDVKQKVDDMIFRNERILNNRAYFIKELKPVIFKAMQEEKLKPDVQSITFIDDCLSREYFEEREQI